MKEPKSVNSRRKHKGMGDHADDLGLDDLPTTRLNTFFYSVEHIVG